MITKYDKEMLAAISDPVKWVELHLGERPRWYQEQILRHPHHRKVLRCGRRIGKCIASTQRIIDPLTGEYASVGELFERTRQGQEAPRLVTLNEELKQTPSSAFFIEDNGVKDTFAVVTKHGNRVELTGNHPVLTIDRGWVEVDALRIGESIATPKELAYFGQEQINKDELLVLAYLIAAGRRNKDNVALQVRYQGIEEEFVEACHNLGIELHKDRRKKSTIYVTGFRNFRYYKDVFKKRLPSYIYTLDKEHLAFFLSSLYAAGAWAFAGRICELGYATNHRPFALDLKHLLLRFGIQTNLVRKRNGEDIYYHLMVYHRVSILKFLDSIACDYRNYEELKTRCLEMTPSEDKLPREVWNLIEEERIEKRLKKSEVVGGGNHRYRTDKGITIPNALRYADNMKSTTLYDLATSDVLWDEVVAIVPLGQKQTYDVFVADTHNLIVEDVFIHNTWTMCAHMLYVCMTNNGGKGTIKGSACVVATPYDNQARLIFDQLKTFIDNNPALKESVSSITKNPYVIQFKNKSYIKLFTAGTRSGAEGGSLRGQRADWLYLDEVDYMSDKDFEAIYAITFEAPKRIGCMIASTPTGRRGMFYKACVEMRFNQTLKMNKENKYCITDYDRQTAEGWKEFYFPTMVNPEWSEAMERELKQQFTTAAYEHEVLAEFGTESIGVFNKDFIDEASNRAYMYDEYPRKLGPIAIGVDWDKSFIMSFITNACNKSVLSN
ncbi:MAG: LAGLIDADG family homing endonuclease [Bacilli bacterium]